MLAGILILWRKPFQVGDQIRTREHEGTVEEINVRSTRLHTYEDTHVVVPNSDVYTNPVIVLTVHERRRTHLIVGIGYGDDIDEARAVIHRVLATTEGVAKEPTPLVYVHELAPSTVNLAVYFWSGPRQAEVLATRHRVTLGIKNALDAAHIDIAYPHTVVLLDRLPPLSLAIEERPRPHPSNGH
jgi:small conductance mechanosensitive channel